MESKVTVGFLRNIIYYAASKGASVAELCETAGITPDFLLKPDEKVSGQLSHKVWQKAEELTADADIGLHLGEQIHPSTLGLVGFVMLSCENLGAALEKLIRYTNLLTDGVQGKMSSKNRLAQIEIEVTRDRENTLIDAPRQRMESSFAAIATVARILTGKQFPVREMRFTHNRPLKTTEHKRIFAAPILFSQKKNLMIFAAEALKYPILLANRDLLPAFEAQAEQILAETDGTETRSNQVRRVVIKKLNGESPAPPGHRPRTRHQRTKFAARTRR